MPTFGNTAIGIAGTGQYGYPEIDSFRHQLTEAGTVVSLSIYCRAYDASDTAKLQLGIYAEDEDQYPTDLLCATEIFELDGGTTPQWYTRDVVTPVLLQPGRYQLAFWAANYGFYHYWDHVDYYSGGGRYGHSRGSSIPASFPTGLGVWSLSGTSFYATYEVPSVVPTLSVSQVGANIKVEWGWPS